MDKDDYFKFLEEVCAYNVIDPFKESHWYTQALLSNVQRGGEKPFEESQAEDTSKESRLEKNLIKYFE